MHKCKCNSSLKNENVLRIYSPSGHRRWVSLHCIVCSPIDALQWMGAVRIRVQTADKKHLNNPRVSELLFGLSFWQYHSLQRIHWRASDAMMHFSKSDEETNSSTSWMTWGWVRFQDILISGSTIPLKTVTNVQNMIFRVNIVFIISRTEIPQSHWALSQRVVRSRWHVSRA